MQITSRSLMLLFFAVSLAGFQLWSSEALAQSTYFTSRGCVNCHAAPVVASCNGCHYHGNRSLKATTNKTSYTPGETVSVTLTSSSTRTGWIRAILYNQSNTQVAVSNGNASGQGGSTTFPATLTAPAPTAPGTYTWKMAYFGNSANTGSTHGEAAVSTNSFTVAAATVTVPPSEAGVFRNGVWYLDANGNRIWGSGDVSYSFGATGDIPIKGDWTGNGVSKMGVFKNGHWWLDTNGNGIWEDGIDQYFMFGGPGDIPVIGDWNGNGITKVGVFRGNGLWFIDANGTRAWDAGDAVFTFGSIGDIPVTGDWNGDGTTKAGVFRGNGLWYLDANGSRAWDAADATFKFGSTGDIPVTGDWNGDGITKVGVFRGNGLWYIDANNSRAWDAVDATFIFGSTGDIPVTGKW